MGATISPVGGYYHRTDLDPRSEGERVANIFRVC